jgi:hypothetical protein
MTSTIARKATVAHFHKMIHSSYERLAGSKFPVLALDKNVTNVEQAVMRGLHDVLPGRAKIIRSVYPLKSFALTNFLYAKFYLNDNELNQEIENFNGDYDQDYKNIKIPFTRKVINLKKIDERFIEKFSPYRQDAMLEELKEVGLGEKEISEVSFIHHIEELFSKGVCPNKWMPQSVICN